LKENAEKGDPSMQFQLEALRKAARQQALLHSAQH
jgi:hypothetical protein